MISRLSRQRDPLGTQGLQRRLDPDEFVEHRGRRLLHHLVGLQDAVLVDELRVKRASNSGNIFSVVTTCPSCCAARVPAATPPYETKPTGL